MMKRITITISEETEAKLKKKKPTFLSLSKFINMILESSLDNLDSLVRLPAYRVGAEDISTKLDTNISTPINEDKVHFESSNFSSKEKNLKNSIAVLGEDVGRESEGNPKKRPYVINSIISRKKYNPERLRPYFDKIEAFWRVKQGTKNLQAYSLQMTELLKILDNLGEKVLIEQLDQACLSGTWKQINYNRTVKFLDKKEEVKQTKHPNSRVFTAKDGFLS
jgi:predicted CopG family antitoxin